MQLCFLSYACSLFPAPPQSQESSSLVLSQTFTVLDISETAPSVAKKDWVQPHHIFGGWLRTCVKPI
jgi:hypothetical protein